MASRKETVQDAASPGLSAPNLDTFNHFKDVKINGSDEHEYLRGRRFWLVTIGTWTTPAARRVVNITNADMKLASKTA